MNSNVLKNSNVKATVMILSWSCLLLICSKLRLPISPVPVTLQTFAVYLIGFHEKPMVAFYSVLLFLFIGACGFHIFAGNLYFTGGYLIGMLFAAPAISLLLKKFGDNYKTMFLAGITGYMIVNVFGLAWLGYVTDFKTAIITGLLPFIIPEIGKIVIAATTKVFVNLKKRAS